MPADIIPPKKRKKKKKKKEAPSLLSFGDDEEEDVEFKVNKTKSRSSAITFEKKRKKKRKKKTGGEANLSLGNKAYLQTSVGRYTPEALSALRGNAIHLSSAHKENIAKKQETKENTNREDIKATEFSTESDGHGAEALNVPGKEQILAARRKREMIRTMGSGQSSASYIPLDSKKKNVGEGTVYGVDDDQEHGGLVTENPDDMEEDVFGDQKASRLMFGDPGKDKQPTSIDATNTNEEEDEDSEQERWINEQIKKGGAKPNRESKTKRIGDGKGKRGGYTPSTTKTTFDVATEMRRLQLSLAEVKQEHERGNRDVNRIDLEIKETETELKQFNNDLSSMNAQYLFYQTLRDKVDDYLGCLNHKAPLIEEAMEEMKELMLSKAKSLRRLVDLHARDEYDIAFGASKPSENQKPQLDEFGRDIAAGAEQGRNVRTAAREARRRKWAGRRKDNEGCWTDDEDELGSTYSEKKSELLGEVGGIFSDAADEFKTVHVIKSKLELLKKRFPQAYTDTYISLSVPLLFAPYVRVELLQWDFMKLPRLDSLAWYKDLQDYGLFGDVSEDDPDLDVVPKLVEKVVTPFITNYFYSTWDPISTAQSSAARTLVREVMDHVDGKLPNPQKLLSTIMDRFHNVVNMHAKFSTVPTATDKEHSQWVFCETRCWRAVKLVRQLVQWRETISDTIIKALAISHITDNVLPFVLKEMSTKPPRVNLVLKIVKEFNSALPPEWADPKQGPYKRLYKGVKAFFKLCKEAGLSADKLHDIKALVKG